MHEPHRTIALLFLVASCGDSGTGEQPDAGPTVDAGRATLLSRAGLYTDLAADEIQPDLILFAPRNVLWSDAAEKRRWIRLPPGTKIDTSDMDHWKFPIGTQFFKEFKSDGVLVETRLIERTGEGSMDYWMGAFVWKDDGSDAEFAAPGKEDIRGTDHDAPAAEKCWACHGGEPGRILGFSAVQLSAATIDTLAAHGLFTQAPAGEFTIPGSPEVAAALGYLHANCGHCHNPNGIARPDTDQNLRLDLADTTPESTNTYLTAVGMRTQSFIQMPYRIVAGDPDASAVVVRMSARGDTRQMPPLATEHPDPTGIAAVRAWIMHLPN